MRAIIAVLNANRRSSTLDLEKVEKIVQQDPIFRKVAPNKYKRLVKEQALILETDLAQALADLVVMVPDVKDRIRIVGIANCIVSTEGRKPENKEKIMLSEIEKALGIVNERYS